jgi:hypothetical protein
MGIRDTKKADVFMGRRSSSNALIFSQHVSMVSLGRCDSDHGSLSR